MRRHFLKLLAGGALLGPAALRALARAADKEKPAAKFKVAFRKADDALKVVDAPEGPVLQVTSKSGIGGAKVTQTDGPALTRLTIQFVGMGMLESFAISDGALKLGGSLERGKEKSTFAFDKAGKPVRDPKGAAATLTVERKAAPKVMEVVLTYTPGPTKAKAWDVSWIDAFRS